MSTENKPGEAWLIRNGYRGPTRSLKYAAEFQYGDNLPESNRKTEKKIPVFGSNGRVGTHDEPNTGSPVVVIGRKGSFGAVNWSDTSVFAIDTTFYVDDTHTDQHLRFLYYLLTALPLDVISKDSAVPGLSTREAYRFRAPNFSLEEQRRIAKFLDRKAAAIDELIDKKRRLIELLEEKRDATINRAVTKGLDPDVPMKDSGFEPIGRIPEHWEVWRLKFLVDDIVDCIHSTPTYQDDGDYIALRTADITPGRLDLQNALRVDREAFKERIRRAKPVKNDIIYSREGERFGIAALVPENSNLCLAQRVMQLRPNEEVARPEFLMWALNSNAAYYQARQDTVGATSPRVNIRTIANMWLPRPPLGEQDQIAAEIRQHGKGKHRVEKRSQMQIKTLEEYRQSLITAAVTGQIDVENYEDDETEPEPAMSN